jgi:hypothetical protein
MRVVAVVGGGGGGGRGRCKNEKRITLDRDLPEAISNCADIVACIDAHCALTESGRKLLASYCASKNHPILSPGASFVGAPRATDDITQACHDRVRVQLLARAAVLRKQSAELEMLLSDARSGKRLVTRGVRHELPDSDSDSSCDESDGSGDD